MPRVHPVLGFANLHCGTCGDQMPTQRPVKNLQGVWMAIARCSRCDVAVSVPIMVTDALVV